MSIPSLDFSRTLQQTIVIIYNTACIYIRNEIDHDVDVDAMSAPLSLVSSCAQRSSADIFCIPPCKTPSEIKTRMLRSTSSADLA